MTDYSSTWSFQEVSKRDHDQSVAQSIRREATRHPKHRGGYQVVRGDQRHKK
jgi:hypothetical protein